MGVEMFPVFNPDVPEAQFRNDGKLLLSEHRKLDDMALENGLTPFSAFGDNRDIPEDFDGDLSELEELLGEWNDWFSIDDGLKTIEGLVAVIEDHPETAKRLREPKYIVDDLKSLVECLRIAQAKGVKFRFEVG